MQKAAADGLLQSYSPAAADKIETHDKDPKGLYYAMVGNYPSFIYNSAVLKSPPKTYADLLAPQFRQKIQYSTPGQAGRELIRMGDIVDKNLMELAQKKIKAQVSFSAEGAEDLRALHQLVIDSFHRAQALLVSGRMQTAAQLLEDKQALRRLERAARDSHLDRLREGKPDSIASSSLHLDVLRDLVRIQSHICALASMRRSHEAKHDAIERRHSLRLEHTAWAAARHDA
ncbi:ABC transporter substrate-binding protein [Paraburkholderia sp. Cpub6]|uniref:ABC transporter substrate-binding protein n=1 Tax=Paraburkholderia sp. Cpub6 TaxID=2723094 RepID=UPI001809982D|nr:ABC transporter substrate-binding protein [Paraburkholderia sp. Cpub6]MBB5463295.1 hypothetical protein [Paraburkholderia sp. Cpub6]